METSEIFLHEPRTENNCRSCCGESETERETNADFLTVLLLILLMLSNCKKNPSAGTDSNS